MYEYSPIYLATRHPYTQPAINFITYAYANESQSHGKQSETAQVVTSKR